MRARRIATFVVMIQGILLVLHTFLYETWIQFQGLSGTGLWKLRIAMALLSVSFVVATLLAWRTINQGIRFLYIAAAAWLGFVSYALFAGLACWAIYAGMELAGLSVSRPLLADVFLTLTLIASLWSIVNASWLRVHRIQVRLPNLPDSWQGRVAALVSDTHLGHVRNAGFLRRIVRVLNRAKPDVVFITGDLYDGTAVDANGAAEPLRELAAPWGAFFITGNHEEFSGHEKYVSAVSRAGVRVLNAEKVDVDGLQIVGVHFNDMVDSERFRGILQRAALDPSRASVLLVHAPDRLNIAEEAGISLQLSGHTHGGQFPPYSWITSRIYGKYVHGLNCFGKMLVFVTWGAGSWGPPMRLGTQPEIVLFEFERGANSSS